uniref:Uncharacterized protein n=1 Tax=Euplotes crassus TaxID=5936 RepID=A0A7S3KFM8_EUPCR|mmetsp:Transcript_25157/g.24923  ORF Transcript_25157/g.24923 Transcript_25157/m.24923 type:complete len:184 (+) Transcript_25157:104-655(+)
MTMPPVGPNYVSFTMMDMHKTITNKKNFNNNYATENGDGLNHSFTASDIEHPSTNFEKEIHQFSQNSSSKDKSSSDRKHGQHKKSQSMTAGGIKPSNTFSTPGIYDPNESPNFIGNKQFNLGDDIKITKSQIKQKPHDINRYVQRKKKRGTGKKKVEGLSSSKTDAFPPPPKSIIKKSLNKFN